MTQSTNAAADRPRWSRAGLALGVRLALPVLPGLVAFALAVGATGARKGFALFDMTLMNMFVFAGASQMVAMEIWPERITLGAVGALALVTATMNARMLLMGASLRPWLAPLPAWQSYPTLHLITDPGWLVTMRYRAEGGNDAAVLLGGSLVIFVFWLAASTVGYVLGALVANPRAIGIDLVMPIFFATLLIPLWQHSGRRSKRAVGWMAASVIALAAERLAGGWWFIVAGAIAGAVAEGWSDER